MKTLVIAFGAGMVCWAGILILAAIWPIIMFLLGGAILFLAGGFLYNLVKDWVKGW